MYNEIDEKVERTRIYKKNQSQTLVLKVKITEIKNSVDSLSSIPNTASVGHGEEASRKYTDEA